MGTVDPGMLVISGRVNEGISAQDAEYEVDQILHDLLREGPRAEELQKVKNLAISSIAFGDVEVINRAMNLAFAGLSGNADLVNREEELINRVTREDVMRVADEILQERNASILYYTRVS